MWSARRYRLRIARGLPSLRLFPGASAPHQRRALTGPAAHRRREDALDAKFLAAEDVRAFALVTGVAEDGPKPVPRERLLHDLRELHDVGLRPPVHEPTEDDVTLHVAEGGEFRETALPVAAMAPAATGVVAGDVARLHAGGVYRRGVALLADQAAATGELHALIKEPGSAPFFRRRFSA